MENEHQILASIHGENRSIGNKSQTFGTSGNIAEPGGDTTSSRCVLMQAPGPGLGAARPLPLTGSRPEDKDEVTTNNMRPWTSCHAAPGGGISKRTVEETRDVAGEAVGAVLLPCPPAGTLLWLSPTAPGSACG